MTRSVGSQKARPAMLRTLLAWLEIVPAQVLACGWVASKVNEHKILEIFLTREERAVIVKSLDTVGPIAQLVRATDS